MKELAKARSLGGVQLRMALLPTGKVAASDTPSTNRTATIHPSIARVPATNRAGSSPVKTVVMPQIRAAIESVIRGPMASPSRPVGS